MNYDIKYRQPTIREPEIEYNVDVAMRYGDMSEGLLVSKYSETDAGPDEDVYDNYARGLLTDMGPDPITMASDEPRGRVSDRSGRLQLQYYGHRGESEPPAHAEMFLGFSDADPRGYAVDPDIKKLRAQEQARMRFINFSPDQADQITGGSRSEEKVIADQQTLFKWTRDRLKVFSRQLDGRREGLRQVWRQASMKAKQQEQARYGDRVQDCELIPQRKANIVSKCIHDSRRFRSDVSDQEYHVQKYTQLGRRTGKQNTQNRLNVTATDAAFQAQDASKHFKTVGILMSEIVRCRTTMQKTVAQDTDYGAHSETQARKHEAVTRDLALILRSLDTQAEWGKGDVSLIVKTKEPTRLQHLANVISLNHLLPAHHYLNAELLYKSVKPGHDMRKIRDQVIGDNARPTLMDVKSVFMKSSAQDMTSGGKTKGSSVIDVLDRTLSTVSYKVAKFTNGDRRIRTYNGERFKRESDDTRIGQNNHTNYRITTASDVSNDAKFHENMSKERHIGKMGVKSAARRHTVKDSAANEITLDN